MDQESNKVTILVYAGRIDKAEFREKVFNDSKYHFLRTVDDMCFFDSDFKDVYKRYYRSNSLPKRIVIMILTYMEMEADFKKCA